MRTRGFGGGLCVRKIRGSDEMKGRRRRKKIYCTSSHVRPHKTGVRPHTHAVRPPSLVCGRTPLCVSHFFLFLIFLILTAYLGAHMNHDGDEEQHRQ